MCKSHRERRGHWLNVQVGAAETSAQVCMMISCANHDNKEVGGTQRSVQWTHSRWIRWTSNQGVEGYSGGVAEHPEIASLWYQVNLEKRKHSSVGVSLFPSLYGKIFWHPHNIISYTVMTAISEHRAIGVSPNHLESSLCFQSKSLMSRPFNFDGTLQLPNPYDQIISAMSPISLQWRTFEQWYLPMFVSSIS